MFSWLKSKRKEPQTPRDQLREAVRAAMPGAAEDTVKIVTAFAGLFTCVAYADQHFDDRELASARQVLARVQGLAPLGLAQVLQLMRDKATGIAAAEASTYARELLLLTAEDFRLEVIDALVDLAAADDAISVAETNMMRSVVRSLGLTQQQYNRAQARYRDKLAVLSGD